METGLPLCSSCGRPQAHTGCEHCQEIGLAEREPKPTTTCRACGRDFPDADMMPAPEGEGEHCQACTPSMVRWRIVLELNIDYEVTRPETWDWPALLDLAGDESARVVKAELIP